MLAAVIPGDRKVDGWSDRLGFFKRVDDLAPPLRVWSSSSAAIGVGTTGLFYSDTKSGVAVAFEGEIFNRADLAERFGVGKGASDVEIIAAVYESQGSDAWDLLDGDFAILLSDQRNGRFFAVRDPFGVIPLYFTRNDFGLFFASSIEDLVDGCELPFVPDGVMVRDWLFNRFETRRTFWHGVDQVFPGHYALVSQGSLRQDRHFFPVLDTALSGISITDASIVLRDALVEATSDCIATARKTMIHLSGGLDSGLLAFCAKRLSEQSRLAPEKAFLGSCRFEGEPHDEGPSIRIAAHELPFLSESWDGKIVDSADFIDPLRSWPSGRRPNNHGPGDLDLAQTLATDTVISGLGGDELTNVQCAWLGALRGQRWVEAWGWIFRPDGTLRRGLGSDLVASIPSFLSDSRYRRIRAMRRVVGEPRISFLPLIPDLPGHFDDNEWLDGSSDRLSPGNSRAIWRRLINPKLWRTVATATRSWADIGVRIRFPFLRKKVIRNMLSLADSVQRTPGISREIEKKALRLQASSSVCATRTKRNFNAEFGRYGRANFDAISALFETKQWRSAPFVRRGALKSAFREMMVTSKENDAMSLMNWRLLLRCVHLEAWWRRLEPL